MFTTKKEECVYSKRGGSKDEMKGDITQKPCGRSWAYVADLNRINSCVVLDETEHK